MMPPPGRRFVERAFPVRTYDIDFAGVVNNIVYIRWLEDLRLALMEEVYPIDRALREDVAPILLETQIRYHRAVTIQDALVGRMWVTDMEKIRWHVAAEFTVGDKVHASASQVGLFIKLSTKRPIAVPAPLRAAYLAGAGR
jgi:acyl-CoA thioester hydrolase